LKARIDAFEQAASQFANQQPPKPEEPKK
jgi:hypothetical protein